MSEAALQVSGPAELEAMATLLRSISGDLVASYERLALRARHMEAELCETNAELERKVRELDETRERLEAILDALPTGVAVRDAGGRIVRVNGALARILGCEPGALLGRRRLPGLERSAAGAREVQRADGDVRVLVARRSEVSGRDGVPAGSVEIVDDRTDLERLAERLHRVDKMAALGTMAGGLAHEIRNPMNAIAGFADLLLLAQRERLEAEPTTGQGAQREARSRRWIEAIREGASEVESIVASLLSLAEPGRLHFETLDARALLAGARELALRGLERPERWDVRVGPAAPSLRADRIQMRQAVRNLIANAVVVQPDGGRVDASARAERDEVVIEVEDAGPGIPREHFHRVADPFFTTRAEGTGLGLSLVHAIAQLHGGALEIDRRRSTLGGARVRIRLPLTPPDDAASMRVGRPRSS